jgi:hypothetical protein
MLLDVIPNPDVPLKMRFAGGFSYPVTSQKRGADEKL